MDIHWVAHMGTMKGTQLIYMDWEGCLASYGNSKVCPGILWTLGSFPGLIYGHWEVFPDSYGHLERCLG